MNMSVTEKPAVRAPEIIEPEEFSPVELFRLAQERFKWKKADFAAVFGWELDTVQKWVSGQKPSRQARIRAATLKQTWGI